MADLRTIEGEATRYVLGELDAAGRREFEARLEQSAELRAQVRELAEGLEAVALACLPKQPPPDLWQRIERAVAGESPRVVAPEFQTGWLRYAWAVAACIAGLLLVGVWLMRGTTDKSPATNEMVGRGEQPSNGGGSKTGVARGTIVVHQAVWKPLEYFTNRTPATFSQSPSNAASQPVQFFFGTASSTSATNLTALFPTADLQRALSAAMARELGRPPGRGAESDDGVDFVDLRPQDAMPMSGFSPVVSATGPLAGFVSGESLFLAFGSNIVPRAQELQFWVSESEDDEQLLGTATLGANPLVIMLPMGVTSSGGWVLTVTGVTPSGASNVIGQVFIFTPSP